MSPTTNMGTKKKIKKINKYKFILWPYSSRIRVFTPDAGPLIHKFGNGIPVHYRHMMRFSAECPVVGNLVLFKFAKFSYGFYRFFFAPICMFFHNFFIFSFSLNWFWGNYSLSQILLLHISLNKSMIMNTPGFKAYFFAIQY